jgi:hypothetical protein
MLLVRRSWPLISVAAWSLKQVCGHLISRIAGPNPTGAIYILCCVRQMHIQQADHSSRGVLLSVCISVCVIKYNSNPVHLQWDTKRSD